MPDVLIAVVALGTRGDVQPIALVAWQLARALRSITESGAASGSAVPSCRVYVSFITHAAHREWILQLQLEFSDGSTGRQLQLHFVSSLPAAVWDSNHPPSSVDTVRAELLQHCCDAFQLSTKLPTASAAQHNSSTKHAAPIPGAFRNHAPSCKAYGCQEQQEQGHQHQQQSNQQQQQQPLLHRLLLFNLFALEGYHIAEALQVPCCVLQPYLVPYSMPSNFKRSFQRADPGMAAVLESVHDGCAEAGDDSACEDLQAPGGFTPACVTWKDVSHWMWPLFTQRWGPWRQEVLGLHPWPLRSALQQHWQGCTFATRTAAAEGDERDESDERDERDKGYERVGCSSHGTVPTETADQGIGRGDSAASAVAAADTSNANGASEATVNAADDPQKAQAPRSCEFSSTMQAEGLLQANSVPARHHTVRLSDTPQAVPVLYGLSPVVTPPPGFWPGSVKMCGLWLTHHLHQQQQHQHQQHQQDVCCHHNQQQQHMRTASSQTASTHQQQQQQQHTCGLPGPLQEFIDAAPGAACCTAASCIAADALPTQLRQQPRTKLLVVDFGSMGSLGLLPCAHTLLKVLLHALALLQHPWRCVLLTGGWSPLWEAYGALRLRAGAGDHGGVVGVQVDAAAPQLEGVSAGGHSSSPAVSIQQGGLQQQQGQGVLQDRSNSSSNQGSDLQQSTLNSKEYNMPSPMDLLPCLWVQHGSIRCHHLLLDAADVLLHHGGSGTTAAALAAGVPQLVCPLQFDQFYWAERVAQLGCSPAPLNASQLFAQEATHRDDPAEPPMQTDPSTTVVSGNLQQRRQHSTQGVLVAAPTPAATAAGSFLAASVLAAQQPGVLEACRQLQQVISQERGLEATVDMVQAYLQHVYM